MRGDYVSGVWTCPVYCVRDTYCLGRYNSRLQAIRGAALCESIGYKLKMHGTYKREVQMVARTVAAKLRCGGIVAMCGHGTGKTHIQCVDNRTAVLTPRWERKRCHDGYALDARQEDERVDVQVSGGVRYLVVDDVLTSGRTMDWLCGAIERAGGTVGGRFAIDIKTEELGEPVWQIELPMTHLQRYRAFVAELPRESVCESCGRTPAQANMTRMYGHHVQPVRDIGLDDPNCYNRGNVMMLCDDCHALMHPLQRYYGARGWSKARAVSAGQLIRRGG